MKQDSGKVLIHGKEYTTVAKRLETVHGEKKLTSVKTEVLSHDPVVIKATILLSGMKYTGISSVSLASGKLIEKQSPYEVAETSAVGRALAFGGYPGSEFASADEMQKAAMVQPRFEVVNPEVQEGDFTPEPMCEKCGALATERKGVTASGRKWHGIFCSTEDRSHTKWLYDKNNGS